ncbi:MORN repeat-containing protein [Leptospira ellinghausenii]|nr:hypothetical protein [Leptospira ellinghausenii]
MKIYLLTISLIFFNSCQTTREKFWKESNQHKLVATCRDITAVTAKTGECIQKTCKPGVCKTGDCLNGKGSMLFPEGSSYVGSFVDGEFQGKGTLNLCDGAVIEGTFQNGFAVGEANFFLADGSRYKGPVVNSKPQGYGMWVSADRSLLYEGDFSDGKKNGYGILESSDGGTWQGEFKNDQLDGEARFKNKEFSLNGEWKAGKQIGEHKYLDMNGPGYVRFSDDGTILEAKTAEDIKNDRVAMQIFARALKDQKNQSDLRKDKDFCNKLMYQLADFVGSSKHTGCSAQCRSACGNMWDINSKEGDRCERQCRLCWQVLEFEPNDCKSVSPYPMVMPDRI